VTLADIAQADGTFAIVALDQRNTLRRMFTAADQYVDDGVLRSFKGDVVAGLSPSASGLLVDPDFGVPAALEDGNLAPDAGLAVAAEPSERGKFGNEPLTRRDPAQNAKWVRGMGGHAVKFLVQLRADRDHSLGGRDVSAEALDATAQVVTDCRADGVPSVVENLIYQLPGEPELSPETRADAIIEAARALNDLKPDLLKLEYPGSAEACRRIAEAVTVPWVVLSAGVGFEEFQDVLRVSCDEGGASGFIAGRAFWKDAVALEQSERRPFLAGDARRRLDACVTAIEGRATPWTSLADN
jgi:tagatose 1,6-diphosphate aldolase/sulfofructosephosphate aldolase